MTRPLPIALSARMAALELSVPGARSDLPEPVAWRLVSGDAPHQEGITQRAVLLLDDLYPATAYRLEVDGMEPLDFQARPCAGAVSPAGLIEGAYPEDADAAGHNATLLQRAIAGLPVGGTLILPPGRWRALPIALRGDMTLRLSEGAVLCAPSVRDGWRVLPAFDRNGDMLGSWEGLPAACFAAPVHAVGAERLVIEGLGKLDGGGAEGDWWSRPKDTREGARRPRGMHLIGCRDTMLLGFTIRNAPSWTIHPQGCAGLVAAGLHIEAPHDSPNTDGFNPESCTDVTLQGVRFSVGDDCIAIKAGKRGPEGEDAHLKPTRGVTRRHCLMERGHGGVVIGSEMSGGVHDVTVEDCEMRGTDRGLRIKTRRGRGGAISNISFRRVRMEGVLTAFSANAYYHCDADGHDGWVQSRAPAPVGRSTPMISGITIEDVDIHVLAHATGCFLGLPEAPIADVRLSRIHVHSLDPAATPASPIMADDVAPVRHVGILREWAEVVCDAPALLSDLSITYLQGNAAQ